MTIRAADRAEIASFIGALFRHADEGTYISLRGFDQTRRDVPPFLIEGVKINGSLDTLIDRAEAAATRCANAATPKVFAPPVATFATPDKATTSDLANGVAISVEIDEGDTTAKRRRLEHLLGVATVVMTSGGDWADPDTGEIHPKLHLHWRLSEPTRTPEEHDALRQARRMAALLVAGDPTGAPPAHPLRMAGSWNTKAAPRLARIVGGNPAAELHLHDALEALQDAIEAAGMQGMPPPPSGAPGHAQAPVPTLRSAMAAIPNPDAHYDQWIRYGYALRRATGGAPEGRDIWDDWSRKSAKFTPAEQDAAWQRIASALSSKAPPRTIGAGTIFFDAAQHGWTRPMPEPPPDEQDPAFWESLARSLEGDPAASEVAEVVSEVPSEVQRKSGIIDPRDWTAPAPLRQWIVDGWIPRGYVTGLYGDGATGKSLICQQLMTSVAMSLPWLGLAVHGGRAFGFMCEDDEDELHRRQEGINKAYRLEMGMLENLRYTSRVGADNLLMTFDDRTNRGTPTDLMAQLCKWLRTYRPTLVVLDTLADIFGGDEIRRAQARQFIQGVGGNIAREFDCGVVIAAHPSQAGLASGKGTGGSTAWNNTFRSRLYLTKPEEEKREDERILSRMKANYSSTDGALTLKWDNGCFACSSRPADAAILGWNDTRIIFEELIRAWNYKDPWSNAPQTRKDGRYFPLWAFTNMGLPEKLVAKALEQWMVQGFIRVVELDRKSKTKGMKVVSWPPQPREELPEHEE